MALTALGSFAYLLKKRAGVPLRLHNQALVDEEAASAVREDFGYRGARPQATSTGCGGSLCDLRGCDDDETVDIS